MVQPLYDLKAKGLTMPTKTKAKSTISLKRKINSMPAFVKKALQENNVWQAYSQRPPYQRNDYIGWITRAKLQATREKRLTQMINELKDGNVYMKMKWNGGR